MFGTKTRRCESWVPHLGRRHGRLQWSGVDLSDLARRFGTPLYVVHHGAIRAAYDRLRTSLESAGLRPRLFFSVKTNPLPDVVKAMLALGAGLEVSTESDLWLAERLAVPGERLVVGGLVMPPSFVERAVALGPRLLVVESLDGLAAVQAAVDKRGAPPGGLAVGLRVNPGAARSRWDSLTSTSHRGSPFGFAVEGPELGQALARLTLGQGLRLAGLHIHLGTHLTSSQLWEEALPRLREVWDQARSMGHRPTLLDVGGGFPCRAARLPTWPEALRTLAARVSRHREEGPPPDPVHDVAQAVARHFPDEGPGGAPEILAEPGRALIGDAGILLVGVERAWSTPGGDRIAVCDGGALGLSPLLLVERHPTVLANRDEGEPEEVTLQGPMPTSLDGLGRVWLPRLRAGDSVAVLGTGAYSIHLATQFAGPRPAVVSIHEDGVPRLVRRRETFEDLVGRDLDLDEPVDSGERPRAPDVRRVAGSR